MVGLEGRTLDRYELRQLVGKGGMADVYVGYDTVLQRLVAVKVFKRDDEELLERFIREARLMGPLRNAHLMPVFDSDKTILDGVPLYYIVMPFMNGGTLRARIRNAPLSPVEACRYLREIADALDYVHKQGIVHRDIKSSNVLLDAEGNSYLADFGIARRTNDITQLTTTGNVLGTVDYVAPELFEPGHKANASSDLYSLGILLFEMVTGRLPFTAEHQLAVVSMHMTKPPPSPRSFVPTLSPQVEQVIYKAMAKRPEQRYRSATELAEAFCQAARSKVPSGEYMTVPRQEEPGGIVDFVPMAAAEANAPTVRSEPPAGKQPSPARATNVPIPTTRPIQPYIPPTPPAPPAQPLQPHPLPPRRPVSPVQTRFMVTVIMVLLTLLVLLAVSVYAVLNPVHPGNPSRGTGGVTQTATAVQITPTPTQIPTPTPNLTATAQAAAAATQAATHATATAIAGATATASANATATAQAQATATAGVIQTVTAGQPAYTDALNDPNNPTTQNAQWDQNDNCLFKPDGYHVSISTTILDTGQLKGCLESGNQYQNFALSVDLTIISGHTGGVFFRVGKKALGAYSGYLFEVDNQGHYKISRSGDFSTGSGNVTFKQDSSPALKTGTNAKNTLQILAGPTSLSFYVNNVFLATWQDTTFTTGDIAFLATTSNGGANADMLYSNLNVYPCPDKGCA